MKRPLLVLALVLSGLVVAAPAAQASCAFISDYGSSLDEAPFLFVGIVEDLTNGDRTAAVVVQEVWKGNVPRTATVDGGVLGEGVASLVDRTYRLGRLYLFAPHAGEGDTFEDNACTATRVFRTELERFRPDDALIYTGPSEAPAPGEPGEMPSSDDGFPWVPVGAAVLVVALGGLTLLRRRGPA